MALLLFSCQRPTVENVISYRGALGVSNLFGSFLFFLKERIDQRLGTRTSALSMVAQSLIIHSNHGQFGYQ